MADHTPTPWQISDVRTVDDTPMIVGGAGFEFGLIADVTEDFDAAFIVKAVNSHHALVKALQYSTDLMEELIAGYIPGSAPNLRDDKRREEQIAENRALLAEPDHG